MPSLQWLGLRWHLSSDGVALLGLPLLAVNAVWLAIYAGFLAAYSRPRGCGGGSSGSTEARHYAALYGLLALLALNVVMAAAMVAAAVQGGRRGCSGGTR